MNTKDEDGLCGPCKGSSFASGSGNSTYYAFCAKPIKEEEVVVKNETKNNSLEAKYTDLQIDHKIGGKQDKIFCPIPINKLLKSDR